MSGFEQLTVMVVEDSAVQRMHAVDLLGSLNVRNVLEAEDGQSALDLLATVERCPDIIMTDLEMPGMDGVDLIRHLAQRKLAHALVVVSSRETALLASVETMAQEHGLTVLGIAQKPLSINGLQALLAKYRPEGEVVSSQTPPPPRCTAEELKTALTVGQLQVYYQPKVTTHSGVMRGVEALIRWQHPQYGFVLPDQFVHLAEETGLIEPLTEFVIETALRQLREWHSRGMAISVAVNLSARSLASPDLADRVSVIAGKVGVEAKYLILEITETAVMSDVALSLGTLARLRLKGFGLAIDDFGTGFSSMQQLARIPFTELKIDRSLVHGASEKPHLQVMLQSTIEMGKKLQLTTVAEGVELANDWQLIRILGCDVAQGFYVATPMPGEELANWLRQGTRHLRPPRPSLA